MLDRITAILLLNECSGDEIWSFETCRAAGVPERWLDELGDCFESGFRSDQQTIYIGERTTNQFEGVRAVDLARRLGTCLGVDVDDLESRSLTRCDLVNAIKETVEDG